MRFFFSLLLTLLPVALSASPENSIAEVYAGSIRGPLNPPIALGDLRPILNENVASKSASKQPQTNAERLAQGLAPLPPRVFIDSTATKRYPSRIQNAPRAGPSTVPVASYIQVVDASTGVSYGYVARDYNSFGELAVVGSMDDAVQISFSDPGSSFTAINVMATNPAVDSLNFLGGVVGYGSGDNIGADPTAFFYLAGTVEEPVSSNPTSGDNSYDEATSQNSDMESAVWRYDDTNNQLLPAWFLNGATYLIHTFAMITEADSYGVLVAPTNIFAFQESIADAVAVNLLVVVNTPPTDGGTDPASNCGCRRSLRLWARCPC